MRIDNKKFDDCLIRAKKNATDIAREIGVTPGAIYYMRFKTGNIRPKTVGKLAEALGVSGDDILVNEDPEASPPVEPIPPPAAELPKPKREAKPKAPAEPPPAWVTDFELYKAEGRAALDDLLADEAWVRKMEQYLPGADVPLTVNRSWDGFWATEKGWINKKKAKTRKINWGATMLNIPRNLVVYKPRDPNQRRFGPQNLDTPEAKRRIYESTVRAVNNIMAKKEAKSAKPGNG